MSAVTSNHVQDILDAVRDGLGPFVLRQYKVRYSRKEYLARLQVNLSLDALEDEAQALEELDFSAWRKAIDAEWDEIFSNKLGHRTSRINTSPDALNARNFLYELQNARNRWAHPSRNSSFSPEDTFRLADTATRLLQTLSAKPEAQKTAGIRSELGRIIQSVDKETSEDSASVEATHFDTVDDGRKAEDSANSRTSMVCEKNEVTIDLSGQDLRKWSLKAGNLQSANLSRVNLAGSDLTMANFADVTLTGAKLTHANLTGSVFSGANLSGATLRKATLDSPLISLLDRLKMENWPVLEETDWWRLGGIAVQNREVAEAKGLYVPRDFDRFVLTDFSRSNLSGADMRDVDFGSDMDQFMMGYFSIVSIASFRHANLSGADLSGAVIACANFEEADLSDVKLDSANIIMTKFTGAKLARAKLTNIPVNVWETAEADFSRADLTYADLSGSYLYCCDFNDAKLSHANCAGAYFSYNSSFQRAEMLSTVLELADLSDANLDEAKLKKANLSRSFMSRSKVHDADLTDANLSAVCLEEAKLIRANLTKANLTKANLISADLTSAVLRNAELKKANFTEADLTGADLADANLMDANFESAILKDANLDKAKFRFTTKLPDGSYWSDDTDLTRFTS